MPFEKGHKKIGGRRKGIPAIFNAAFSAAEACQALGVNPFAVLTDIAAGNHFSDEARPAAEALCRYLQRQFHQVETGVRRSPEEIVADLMADPELCQRV